jgi:YHYH protein
MNRRMQMIRRSISIMFLVACACCASALQAAQYPEDGWWWNPAQSGRGFLIERQGNTMFIGTFHYAANGRPEWYVMSGTYNPATTSTGNIGSTALTVYATANGQCIGCAYVAPSVSVSTQNPASITFSDSQRASLVWPGETIALQRQFWSWRDQVDQLDGNWLLSTVTSGAASSQVVKITANTSATTRTAAITSLTGTSVGSLSIVNNVLTLVLGTQSLPVLAPEATRFYAGTSTSSATQVIAVRLTDTPFSSTTTLTGTSSTASVLCPFTGTFAGSYSSAGALTANWSWTCSSTMRTLIGNGLPNHAVGTFPNTGNPNTISAQNVSATMTLTPVKGTTNTQIGGPGGANVYALNSVKFDPGTAGTCPGTMTLIANCNLAMGTDVWRVEALGQTTFNFGVDTNNAHVQPTGEYHYHGMPEGLLSNAGATAANPKMVLVGWASDDFPVYARYCYSDANSATSAIKVCTGSYVKDTVADAGRPATTLVALGAFVSDWTYSAGSGDLDDCNGRTGVTPEFPNGIYHYMATDSYPYFSRCIKGVR